MTIPVPRARSVATWLGQVAAWCVLLVAVGALAAAVVVPRVGGGTPYSILTGSMEPTLRPGDLVVVRPADIDRIGIGSVITYQLESGQPSTATHRVVAIGWQAGERVVRTQGDANNVPDRHWVRAAQIRGELWYRVPWLGHLHSAMSFSQRTLLVNVAAGGLLAYAAVMFTGAWRERRRSHASPLDEVPT